MPMRTLNYTQRKPIYMQDVQITVLEDGQGLYFEAFLNLKKYSLPSTARVFVEAYYRTRYMRFDFGTVEKPQAQTDCRLSLFDATDRMQFRVKVVSALDRKGLLLAVADQIRPHRPSENTDETHSLLDVQPDANLGQEIWKIVFEENRVRLNINAALGNLRDVVREPGFSALVYPQILRTVLWRIMIDEDYLDTENREDWRAQWLIFAR
ncbi:MAG TPA: hypothetical protein PLX03_10615, partial [Candidatus Hydrogenedentes bacterium]|nr:hypothetical protein [Candidatus Hydrogenedentota bacterium]